jgi:hypothetical protein
MHAEVRDLVQNVPTAFLAQTPHIARPEQVMLQVSDGLSVRADSEA